MTSREFARVLLKVLGIYILFSSLDLALTVNYQIYALIRGPQPGGIPVTPDAWAFTALSSMVWLLSLGLGYLMIFKTSTVLSWFFRDEEPATFGSPVNSLITQELAYSLVGIGILSYAVPKVVKFFGVMLYQLLQFHQNIFSAYTPTWGDLVVDLCQITFGLWLFLGSRGIAAAWRNLQGIQPPFLSDDSAA